VVGLPDETWGESPHAFVVFKAGQAATAEALRDVLRQGRPNLSAQ
jgi:acyl-CoA synthetase (AMP-forming)/AMP-acid ligase II